MIQLRRSGEFIALMQNPERVLNTLNGYFMKMLIEDPEPDPDGIINEFLPDADLHSHARPRPTVPGLISYLGADRALFFELKGTDKHMDRFPADSIHYVRQACLIIEDSTIQEVLCKRGNPAFAKFLLSAYNDASEKSIQQQEVTHNHLHITLATPDSVKSGLGDQFRREAQCLEGKTSALINKRIDLGKIGQEEDSDFERHLKPESGEAIDVTWADVTPEDDDDMSNFI